MESQSPSNLFVSVLTITIITYGFATITCVSARQYKVHILNGLNGPDTTLELSCGESHDLASNYKPKGPPQVTLKRGESHVWALDKQPHNGMLACQFTWTGLMSKVRTVSAIYPENIYDYYYQARNDKILFSQKPIDINDPAKDASNWRWHTQEFYDYEPPPSPDYPP